MQAGLLNRNKDMLTYYIFPSHDTLNLFQK